ncbi:hypothetical protein P692DRAFT_20362243 [Suillus brevipes Sb2]|nr:hypothetical protein P692DRAFT_20362243 [Suillus brevipes Sb2]
MGLLTYFSSSSNRVASEIPLRDDHVAALDKLLEPAILILNDRMVCRLLTTGRQATTENVIAVGRKCCWCCDRLRLELQSANNTRFKFPGST